MAERRFKSQSPPSDGNIYVFDGVRVSREDHKEICDRGKASLTGKQRDKYVMKWQANVRSGKWNR